MEWQSQGPDQVLFSRKGAREGGGREVCEHDHETVLMPSFGLGNGRILGLASACGFCRYRSSVAVC